MMDKTPQKDAKEAVAGWIDTQSPTPTDDEMTRTGSITDPALQEPEDPAEGEPAMTDLDAQVKVTVPDPEPEKEPDVKVEVDVETPAEPTDDDEKEDAS